MPQIDLGKIVGDQGPQGPRGLQGNPGEKGETGSPGPGVAAGGAANQVLVKHSGTNFDTKWVDAGSLPIFAGVQDAVAIVADGDTHPAIADGQFVYVRNHSTLAEGLYKATAAIGTDVALTTSNLTADSAGGLNDLQAQVTTLNDKITTTEATLADSIAIVANGDTHAAITSGQYVYVKNHSSLTDGLYKATAAIGTNATLSTSNLTADGSGGLNDLKGDIDSLNSKITTIHPVTELGTMSDLVSLINESASGLFVNCRIGGTIVNKLCGVSSRQGTINAFKSNASSDYIEYTVIDTEAAVYSGFYRISTDTATYNQLASNSEITNVAPYQYIDIESGASVTVSRTKNICLIYGVQRGSSDTLMDVYSTLNDAVRHVGASSVLSYTSTATTLTVTNAARQIVNIVIIA